MESVIGAFPSPLTSTDSLITGATSSCRVSRRDRGATCVTPGRQLGALAQAAAGGTPQRPQKAPSPERGAAGCPACRPSLGPVSTGTEGTRRGPPERLRPRVPGRGTPQPRAGADTGRQAVATLAHEAAALSLLSGSTFFLQIFFFLLMKSHFPFGLNLLC